MGKRRSAPLVPLGSFRLEAGDAVAEVVEFCPQLVEDFVQAL